MKLPSLKLLLAHIHAMSAPPRKSVPDMRLILVPLARTLAANVGKSPTEDKVFFVGHPPDGETDDHFLFKSAQLDRR